MASPVFAGEVLPQDFFNATSMIRMQSMVFTMVERRRTLEQKNRDVMSIIAAVARETGFSAEELLSLRKQKPLAFARHVAMHACIEVAGCSAREAACYLHRTDHTSALYAYKVVERVRKRDQAVEQLLARICRSVLRGRRGVLRLPN